MDLERQQQHTTTITTTSVHFDGQTIEYPFKFASPTKTHASTGSSNSPSDMGGGSPGPNSGGGSFRGLTMGLPLTKLPFTNFGGGASGDKSSNGESKSSLSAFGLPTLIMSPRSISKRKVGLGASATKLNRVDRERDSSCSGNNYTQYAASDDRSVSSVSITTTTQELTISPIPSTANTTTSSPRRTMALSSMIAANVGACPLSPPSPTTTMSSLAGRRSESHSTCSESEGGGGTSPSPRRAGNTVSPRRSARRERRQASLRKVLAKEGLIATTPTETIQESEGIDKKPKAYVPIL